jgi:hypothetical protein
MIEQLVVDDVTPIGEANAADTKCVDRHPS